MLRSLLASSSVVLVLGLAACSDSEDGDVSTPADEESADEPSTAEDAGLSGASGVITIEGVEYPFEATGCIDLFGEILADGTGTTDDGTVYFAGVSYLLNVRNDDLLPPEMSDDELAAAIASGDIQEDVSVLVDLGRAEVLGEVPADQPSFRAERSFGNDIEGSLDSWQFVDGVLSGSGTVIDRNGVALPGGTEGSLEFVATCG